MLSILKYILRKLKRYGSVKGMGQLGEKGNNEMYRGICKKALIRKERLGQKFYFQNQTNCVGTYKGDSVNISWQTINAIPKAIN